MPEVSGKEQRVRPVSAQGSQESQLRDADVLGLIDHREWTSENGHNNALRIGGLGAPRAFHVSTLRTIGFPNVSWGEDYAVALRLSREYPLGRIYDSLYWCRRWEGNSDHALPLDMQNRYASYKDRLRSIEIAARQHWSAK